MKQKNVCVQNVKAMHEQLSGVRSVRRLLYFDYVNDNWKCVKEKNGRALKNDRVDWWVGIRYHFDALTSPAFLSPTVAFLFLSPSLSPSPPLSSSLIPSLAASVSPVFPSLVSSIPSPSVSPSAFSPSPSASSLWHAVSATALSAYFRPTPHPPPPSPPHPLHGFCDRNALLLPTHGDLWRNLWERAAAAALLAHAAAAGAAVVSIAAAAARTSGYDFPI